MEHWKEKWSELSRFRQVLLAVMAVMIVGFAVANGIACSREGLSYQDTLLYPRHDGAVRQYAGRIDGEHAVLTIHPDKTVEYRWGEYAYGPYQVIEDASAAPKDFWGEGIEIRQGERVLFRGGYSGNRTFPLYDASGEPLWNLTFTVTGSSGGSYYVNGELVNEREWQEPGLGTIALWAMEPEQLAHRGSFGLYLMVTLIALLNIAQICFPGFFFRMSLRWHVKDPELAEPSDFYVAMEHLEWIIVAVVCLVLYSTSLMAIQ